MKTIKLLLLVAAIVAANSVSAQFVNSSSSTPKAKSSSASEGWSSINFSYDNSVMRYTDDDDDDWNMKSNGFTLGYSRALSIVSTPLFFEIGAGLSYASYKNEYDESTGYYNNIELGYFSTTKLNMFGLNIPVALKYSFALNDDLSFVPMFGFNFNIGLVGKRSYKWEYTYYDDYNQEFNGHDGADDYNVYSEDDMGEGYAYKRFQVGVIAGAEFHYKRSIFGYKYTSYITEIAEDYKVGLHSISVGYKF